MSCGVTRQLVKFAVDQFPGQADGFQLADGGGLAADGVAVVDQAGDDLGAYALELFGAGRCGLEFFKQLPDAFLHVGEGFLLLHVRRGRDQEQAVAAGEGVVAGRRAGHQLLATLQAGRHARAVAAVEQGRDQAQGITVRGPWRWQTGHVEA
jgi:hypothetical protein